MGMTENIFLQLKVVTLILIAIIMGTEAMLLAIFEPSSFANSFQRVRSIIFFLQKKRNLLIVCENSIVLWKREDEA